jgi:hypothetical protein
VVPYLAPSIQIWRKRSPQFGVWRRVENAVYLDGVGHNGDSRDAISSDAFRIAAGIAEMKMLDRIEHWPAPTPAIRNGRPGRPPLVIQQTAQLRAQNDSLSFSPAHDGSSLHLNFRVLAALSRGRPIFHATGAASRLFGGFGFSAGGGAGRRAPVDRKILRSLLVLSSLSLRVIVLIY